MINDIKTVNIYGINFASGEGGVTDQYIITEVFGIGGCFIKLNIH